MSRVEFYKSGLLRQWRWRVRAANGEIVASGESHSSQRDAMRAFQAATEAMQEAWREYAG